MITAVGWIYPEDGLSFFRASLGLEMYWIREERAELLVLCCGVRSFIFKEFFCPKCNELRKWLPGRPLQTFQEAKTCLLLQILSSKCSQSSRFDGVHEKKRDLNHSTNIYGWISHRLRRKLLVTSLWHPSLIPSLVDKSQSFVFFHRCMQCTVHIQQDKTLQCLFLFSLSLKIPLFFLHFLFLSRLQ